MQLLLWRRRGTSWRSVGAWAKEPTSMSDYAHHARELTGIRLVREQHQEHFTPNFVSADKVLMCGTMIGEGPESVRVIQTYLREKNSPRQLTGLRLTSDLK